jgi:hypothetical protein
MPTDEHITRAERFGRAAGRLGRDVSTCPYSANGDDHQRVLARRWVHGYHSATPGSAAESFRLAEAFDREQLHHYWTRGEGLAKWFGHPHAWTALRDHLAKYVDVERANRMASEWYHEVTGHWIGSEKGDNPVGPG